LAELDKRGDELRATKAYLDAIDYYQAALNKEPQNAVIQNKDGHCIYAVAALPHRRQMLSQLNSDGP